jgi:hypothetical protein
MNETIDKAIKLTSTLEAHLSEEPACPHSIKEIAREALRNKTNSHWVQPEPNNQHIRTKHPIWTGDDLS